jgi:hypothetical protein
MSAFLQQNQVRVQTPPPRPVDGDELGRKISEAIERSLGQRPGSEQAQAAREEVRAAIEEMKAEIQEARAEGRSITIQPPFDPENVIPAGAVDISIAFFLMMGFIIVGLPLARAFARRMDRKGETAGASEVTPRLDRIEQAIEAIAIEVERVSEGQRYTTKAISELRGLPAANPIGGWPAGAHEPERVPVGESTRRP